jgi:hypothetical protein
MLIGCKMRMVICKLMSWLSSQEPQLGMMMVPFKCLMVKRLGQIRLESVVVREKGKF